MVGWLVVSFLVEKPPGSSGGAGPAPPALGEPPGSRVLTAGVGFSLSPVSAVSTTDTSRWVSVHLLTAHTAENTPMVLVATCVSCRMKCPFESLARIWRESFAFCLPGIPHRLPDC